MVLKGDKGAVQFVLYTNWQLPHVAEEFSKRGYNREPMPVDVGYHSLSPLYEGQEICNHTCEYLNGKPCYYDGSGLQAERVYEILLKEGSEGVWKELESRYNELFS